MYVLKGVGRLTFNPVGCLYITTLTRDSCGTILRLMLSALATTTPMIDFFILFIDIIMAKRGSGWVRKELLDILERKGYRTL